MKFICGLLILASWMAMAYFAYASEWAHLLGALIFQIAMDAVRDAVEKEESA